MTTHSETKYAFGSGSHGCLYDHREGPFDSKESAIDAAIALFEDALDEAQDAALRLALRREHYSHLPRGAGADYIELFEVAEDWSPEAV